MKKEKYIPNIHQIQCVLCGKPRPPFIKVKTIEQKQVYVHSKCLGVEHGSQLHSSKINGDIQK